MLRSKLATLRDRLPGREDASEVDAPGADVLPDVDVPGTDLVPDVEPDALPGVDGDQDRLGLLFTVLSLVGIALAAVGVVARLVLDRMGKSDADGGDDTGEFVFDHDEGSPPPATAETDETDETAETEETAESAELGETDETNAGEGVTAEPTTEPDTAEEPAESRTDSDAGTMAGETEPVAGHEPSTPAVESEDEPEEATETDERDREPASTTRSSDRTADGDGPRIAPLVGIGALVAMRLFVDWLREDELP